MHKQLLPLEFCAVCIRSICVCLSIVCPLCLIVSYVFYYPVPCMSLWCLSTCISLYLWHPVYSIILCLLCLHCIFCVLALPCVLLFLTGLRLFCPPWSFILYPPGASCSGTLCIPSPWVSMVFSVSLPCELLFILYPFPVQVPCVSHLTLCVSCASWSMVEVSDFLYKMISSLW